MKICKLTIALMMIIFLMTSCYRNDNNVSINKLILFGYSGFCFKDSKNNVYPSDEIWHNDSTRLYHDSTRLDIRQYFEYKRDSITKIAGRKPRKSTEYFLINLRDSTELIELINNSLIGKNYHNHYGFTDSLPRMYDGWHYSLYYGTSKKIFGIDYIPEMLPDSLRILHNRIIKIIVNDQLSMTSKFRFDSITNIEAMRLFNKNPPPPMPPNFHGEVIFQQLPEDKKN